MRELKIKKQTTYRDSRGFEIYLNDIGKSKRISVEQEVELARRIKQGDNEALAKLCEANTLFVVSVSKQYQGIGVPLSDLVSAGNIGLVKAAKLFDETRGFKFISYAVWWIRQSILESISVDARIIRLPGHIVGGISKVKKVSAKLEQHLHREPTVTEISEVMEVSLNEASLCISNKERHLSLDSPTTAEGDYTMLDKLMQDGMKKPGDDVKKDDMKIDIKRAFTKLSERQAEVLRLYFGFDGNRPRNFREIGEELDISHESVRQIFKRAIANLKNDRKVTESLRYYLN